MVPRWVKEDYGIESVLDLQDHWELFKDQEDPSKGVLYNGIIGWAATEINAVKLEAYGLTRYFSLLTAGSAPALEATLETSYQRRQPVVGFYWEPTPLMGAYDWHILDEPPYTQECWEKIIAATADKGMRPFGTRLRVSGLAN